LGLGGASIYVPVFFWLGIPLEQAILAGLFLNVLTTAISSYNFHRHGLLSGREYKAAIFIFAGAFLGAPIGVWLAQVLPPRILIGIFAIVLFAAALRMHWPPARKPKSEVAESGAGFVEEVGGQALGTAMRRAAVGRSVAMGSGSGVLSGTLGIGGGVFLVPFLIESGMQPKRAAILSHVCTFLASLLGLLGHLAFAGMPNLPFLFGTGAAAAAGSFIGSAFLAKGRVSAGQIRTAFVVLLFLFSIKLGMDFFGIGGAPVVLYD
jgi:uncharacterized membrane protein YfcA